MFRNVRNFKLKGRNIPEELNLKQHRRQTLKSRKLWQCPKLKLTLVILS
jgi:hypothetical protein